MLKHVFINLLERSNDALWLYKDLNLCTAISSPIQSLRYVCVPRTSKKPTLQDNCNYKCLQIGQLKNSIKAARLKVYF